MKHKHTIYILLATWLAMLPIGSHAQHWGYVGDYISLPAPSGRAGYDVYNYAFGSTSSAISVSSYGSVQILSYFQGSESVFCDVYYVRQYIVAGRMYSDFQNGRQYYTITCRPRTITGLPNSVTLDVGESQTLNWSISPYSSSARVTWYSKNSNVVTVNSNGKLQAVGPGTTTVVAENNAGPNASVSVTVRKVDPTGVSLPQTASIYIDESTTLTPTLTPTNAASDFTWESKNTSVATVSNGRVTGVSAGKAEIWVTTVKGGYKAKCDVTVTEPPFTFKNFSISNGATQTDVFTSVTATYSHSLNRGDKFVDISLTDDKGAKVDGEVILSGTQLTFKPTKALSPLTKFTLTIPAKAVKNKWGTAYERSESVSFTTRDWEYLTLTLSPDTKFVSADEQIVLIANVPSANIYYTTDGTTPSAQSTRYTKPIALSQALALRAIATMDGYYTSQELRRDIYISNVEVVSRYPDQEPLYIYKDANPRISYSNKMVKGELFNSITLIKDGEEKVACELIVSGNTLSLVPKAPLDLGHNYKVSIPGNALETIQGEPCKEISWTFSTGNYALATTTGSQEIGTALKSDGSLWTWGMMLKAADASDGGYSYETQTVPKQFVGADVKGVATGYTHHALVKTDGSLWMWGRQLCGEFGNGTTAAATQPIMVMKDSVDMVSLGLQTTAVVKNDGSLWMCGRNDYGQLGNGTRQSCQAFVKVMDGVAKVYAGWNATYALKTDGTLWAWGDNQYGQLGDGTLATKALPVKITEGVSTVAASARNAAFVKSDGTLWICGDNQYGQLQTGKDSLSSTPVMVMTGIKSVSIGDGSVMAIDTDGKLWAWGRNAYGQLGNGSDSQVQTPTSVMNEVSTVAQGWQNTVALKNDGSVWTWGLNNRGVLGNEELPSTGVYSSYPKMIIEGRNSKTLTGIGLDEKVLQLDLNERAVVPFRPQPLLANYSKIVWSSTDSSVADVNERGIVTANSYGQSTVTATISDDNGTTYTAICTVNVKNPNDVDERSVTLSSDGYATFYDSRQHFSLPAGLTAQVVTGITDNKLSYKVIAEGGTARNTIPKGVGVMLSSSKKQMATYTLKSEQTAPEFNDANLLHGSDEATKTSGDGYHYKLAYGPTNTKWSSVIGWYWGANNGGAFDIGGHKAWLVLPKSGSTRGYSIDGESMGIEAVENSTAEKLYDLQGKQIVRSIRKGVYIKKGKKVLTQ
jgi:uncharacterized protein YjdB